MDKNTKVILSLIGIGIISYFYFSNKKKLVLPKKIVAKNKESKLSSFCSQQTKFPIELGSKGATICAMQKGLNLYFERNNIKRKELKLTGILDNETEQALNDIYVKLPINSSDAVAVFKKIN